MTSTTLGYELEELEADIICLGDLACKALEQALKALELGDRHLAGKVIEEDIKQAALRNKIEGRALHLLSWAEPLSETTLRYLLSSMLISKDLKHIENDIVGIAKMQLQMHIDIINDKIPLRSMDSLSESGSILQSMVELGHEALRVLLGTQEAFKERSIQRAKHLWREDDVVDVRYHMIRHDLLQTMTGKRAIILLQSDPDGLIRATYFLWMAHSLERVADHCTNICERIAYMIEGKQSIPDLST